MQNTKLMVLSWLGRVVPALAILLLAGCHCTKQECCETTPASASSAPAAPAAEVAPATAAPAASAAAAAPAAVAAPAAPAPEKAAAPIRIKAGRYTAYTDADGNAWLPDQGFADGDTTERAEDLQIAGAKDPALYRSEHYAMSAFSYPVPNGKYTVKLHFAETFEGVTATGERVFSYNVEGKAFKDFDILAKAGGPQRAYIESVDVEVTDGKLDITFTPQAENPAVNAIEILPQP